MANKRINFAIIGNGRIADVHAKIISESEESNLIGVYDINKERSKKFSKKYSATIYKSYNEVLSDPSVDIVDICTPNSTHASLAISAANLGKHVLCEKPMALNLKDADDMIHACKINNVKLFVVKQNRFNPLIIKLKEALDDGRFGKLVLVSSRVLWSRHQNYYDTEKWRGTVDQDGGVLINQAIHHIDLLQWLAGPVKSVFASAGKFTHDIETEDTAVALLNYQNLAKGTLEVTTSTYKNNIESSITIIGEKGSVKIGGQCLNKLELWQFNGKENILGQEIIENDKYTYHKLFITDLINELNGKTGRVVDGNEAKKSLKIADAMYRSIQLNKEIFL